MDTWGLTSDSIRLDSEISMVPILGLKIVARGVSITTFFYLLTRKQISTEHNIQIDYHFISILSDTVSRTFRKFKFSVKYV